MESRKAPRGANREQATIVYRSQRRMAGRNLPPQDGRAESSRTCKDTVRESACAPAGSRDRVVSVKDAPTVPSRQPRPSLALDGRHASGGRWGDAEGGCTSARRATRLLTLVAAPVSVARRQCPRVAIQVAGPDGKVPYHSRKHAVLEPGSSLHSCSARRSCRRARPDSRRSRHTRNSRRSRPGAHTARSARNPRTSSSSSSSPQSRVGNAH